MTIPQRCPICAQEGGVVVAFTVRSCHILKCGTCGGHFRPQNADLVLDNERTQETAFSERYVAARAAIARWLMVEARRLAAIRQRFHPVGGRLLELGCSTGELLVRFRQLGYSVKGVELVEAAAKAARERYGLDVSSVDLSEIGDGSCETFVAIHTLEHIPDQVGAVGAIRRILTPGGLVLIEVPSISSWNVRLRGDRADVFSDEHVIFHSVGSLRRLFDTAGFEVCGVWTHESLTGLFNTLVTVSGVTTVATRFVRWIRSRSTNRTGSPRPSADDPGFGHEETSGRDGQDGGSSREPAVMRSARSAAMGMAVFAGLLLSPVRWSLSQLGLGGSIILVARRPFA